jgi:hypothetical protein
MDECNPASKIKFYANEMEEMISFCIGCLKKLENGNLKTKNILHFFIAFFRKILIKYHICFSPTNDPRPTLNRVDDCAQGRIGDPRMQSFWKPGAHHYLDEKGRKLRP